MTLNSSGPISLGGSTSGQSVNLELNKSATAQISFNDAAVRTLTGTSAGTALVMPTNFYGKSNGPIVTVGSYILTGKVNLYYYGYDGATGGSPTNFGSITNGTFSGATVKAVFSSGISSTTVTGYTVIFDGNRAAGFVDTLTVNGTAVSGTFGSPSYNSTNNETSFTMSVSGGPPTLFGTTTGVAVPVILT